MEDLIWWGYGVSCDLPNLQPGYVMSRVSINPCSGYHEGSSSGCRAAEQVSDSGMLWRCRNADRRLISRGWRRVTITQLTSSQSWLLTTDHLSTLLPIPHQCQQIKHSVPHSSSPRAEKTNNSGQRLHILIISSLVRVATGGVRCVDHWSVVTCYSWWR